MLAIFSLKILAIASGYACVFSLNLAKLNSKFLYHFSYSNWYYLWLSRYTSPTFGLIEPDKLEQKAIICVSNTMPAIQLLNLTLQSTSYSGHRLKSLSTFIPFSLRFKTIGRPLLKSVK